MGTTCAWCDSILHGGGTSEPRISHTICRGCLEELKTSLSAGGLRLVDGDLPPPTVSRAA